eukprot:scaffold66871_cov45-Phaeocystis_antarctica.AAC.2
MAGERVPLCDPHHAVRVELGAGAVVHVMLPLARVLGAILPYLDAAPVRVALHQLTVVVGAAGRRERVLALTVVLVALPLALVGVAVDVGHLAVPVHAPGLEIALVHVAARQGQLAAPGRHVAAPAQPALHGSSLAAPPPAALGLDVSAAVVAGGSFDVCCGCEGVASVVAAASMFSVKERAKPTKKSKPTRLAGLPPFGVLDPGKW